MTRVFIDDVRDPPDDGNEWVVYRYFVDFYFAYRWEKFFPSFISFDHDLGEGKTGHDIAKLIVQWDLAGNTYPKLPDDFHWTVHSMNPIGRVNIDALLESYIEFKHEFNRKATHSLTLGEKEHFE